MTKSEVWMKKIAAVALALIGCETKVEQVVAFEWCAGRDDDGYVQYYRPDGAVFQPRDGGTPDAGPPKCSSCPPTFTAKAKPEFSWRSTGTALFGQVEADQYKGTPGTLFLMRDPEPNSVCANTGTSFRCTVNGVDTIIQCPPNTELLPESLSFTEYLVNGTIPVAVGSMNGVTMQCAYSTENRVVALDEVAL
jgi:hypothetical protein